MGTDLTSQELRGLPAPAKLNLYLHVTGRRADGYHELETVFQCLDWADSIDLLATEGSDIEFSMRAADGQSLATDLHNLPPEDNLVVRAARVLQAYSSKHSLPLRGAKIILKKQLPSGAGLGGGSSNAATTLLGLNHLWGLNLSRSLLKEIALPLGSDLPFFLHGSNAYATGVGETLSSIELPRLFFVVIHPGISVPTPVIFKHGKLTRNTKPVRILGSLPRIVFDDSVLGDSVILPGRNDLEAVASECFPPVAKTLQLLTQVCQQFRSRATVRMTGSGASCFAVFSSLDQAQAVAAIAVKHLDSIKESADCCTPIVKVCRGVDHTLAV